MTHLLVSYAPLAHAGFPKRAGDLEAAPRSGAPKFRTVGTSMYLYMHDTYVLAGVRVYDVGGALAMASAVQGATIRQRRPRHAARASVHLPRHSLRLPSNSCWSSSRSGSRALGRRHTTKPSRTGHAEYASRRSLRSVGMVYRRGEGVRRAATATEAEGSVVWTRRCLRLLAAVSYRVL